MQQHTISLIGGNDDETGEIIAEPVDKLCRVTFHYRGKTIQKDATDYFGAFYEVRLQLEKEQLIPFCYGASLNVYPSGMCRDMGSGLIAYRLKLGVKPAKPGPDSLVRIFDAGPDVIPSSVANQKQYFEEWLQSVQPR